MERKIIYQGKLVIVYKAGSQLQFHLLVDTNAKDIKTDLTAYNEQNLITKMNQLASVISNKVARPTANKLITEIDEAKAHLMSYYMYGDPDRPCEEPDDVDLAFQYDDGAWNTKADQDHLSPEEASKRLADMVSKRPSCYASHDASSRCSRCLICECEHDCIGATKSAEILKDSVSSNNNFTDNRKENKFMKQMENLFKEFYPSEVPSGEVALTMGGQLAVSRKDGSYVRYNATTGQIENQMNLVISSSKLDKMYILMPTQINQLQTGDIIKEKDTYYQVIAIDSSKNRIKAANLSTGTESNIKIETNIFTGQKMYRKVFSFFNMIQNQQGTANPMAGAGMMNPMALMMLDSFGDSGDDAMKMMAMMSMMNPQAGSQGMMNPMMMYFMMGDSKDGSGDDWIKMMAMSSMMQQMGGMNPFAMMNNQQVPGQMSMDETASNDPDDWDEDK